MKNTSIKMKLYIIIAVVMIPLLIVQLFSIFDNFQHGIEMELRSDQDFAEVLAELFQNYIRQIWAVEWASGLTISENPKDKAFNRKYLREVKAVLPTIQAIGWVSTDGIIEICSDKTIEGLNIKDRQYIQRILNGEERVISELIIDRKLSVPTFVIARAIRKENKLVGIIAATVITEKLNQVLPENRISDRHAFGLIDCNGTFVYKQGIYDVASRMIKASEESPSYKALKGERQIIRKHRTSACGHNYMGVYQPIGAINWVVFATTNYDEFVSAAMANLRRDIVLLLALTVASLYLAIQISSQIINPARRLEEAANIISAGDFTIRTHIEGNDELAAAGKAFDHMVTSIEEYDRLKTQFFANLSHEFKTPLNIILTSLQLVDSMHLNGINCSIYNKLKNYFRMMQQNCYRLLRLMNNLIDLTRMDAGFMKNHLTVVNIVAFIEDITQSVVRYAEAKGICIIFDTDVEEKVLLCDPDKIERIILNLLSNAMKFTGQGGTIWVSIQDGPESITISVKDTGIGIPKDKAGLIFERFRQVDTSLHRANEGSGIGLSLVKGLVEAHHGTIEVKSEPDKGAEFIVILPVLDVDAEAVPISEVRSDNMDRVQKIDVEFSDIYSD